VVIICATFCNIENPSFYPHSVLIHFLWYSQYKLCSNKHWSVCLHTGDAICLLWGRKLIFIYCSDELRLCGLAMAQAVSRWPPTTGVQFQSQESQCYICEGHIGTEMVFIQVLRSSSVSIVSPVLHAHLHLHVSAIKWTNGRSRGPFQKATIFRKKPESIE